MIHTIKIDGSYMPEGWVPVRFGRVRPGEHYIDKGGTARKWNETADSYELYLIVERVKWEPKDGDKVWTFGPLVGVTSVFFMGRPELAQAYENSFLFETEFEAREAYSATLALMKKLKEEK